MGALHSSYSIPLETLSSYYSAVWKRDNYIFGLFIIHILNSSNSDVSSINSSKTNHFSLFNIISVTCPRFWRCDIVIGKCECISKILDLWQHSSMCRMAILCYQCLKWAFPIFLFLSSSEGECDFKDFSHSLLLLIAYVFILKGRPPLCAANGGN